MTLYEIIGNLHMHTPYSDGEAYHAEIAKAAHRSHLDFVVVTDHNCWVDGVQGYYGNDHDGYVLVMTGEEIHDRKRLPQVNHCLIYNAGEEMLRYADNPQKLIDESQKRNALSFLAHPYDDKIKWQANSAGIPWVNWEIEGFTGLEIWNYMSVFKDIVSTPAQTLRHVFQPELGVISPRSQTLKKWDDLLAAGQRVVGIGNSDAHGTRFKIAFFHHIIFPYDYLFNCVNTHVLLSQDLSGQWQEDAQAIYSALGAGNAFISYGIVGDARGFRFTAQGAGGTLAHMGEGIKLSNGVTLQVIAPDRGHIKLIRHGKLLKEADNVENLSFNALERGAYRVEIWKHFKNQERCWILSNPIYVE